MNFNLMGKRSILLLALKSLTLSLLFCQIFHIVKIVIILYENHKDCIFENYTIIRNKPSKCFIFIINNLLNKLCSMQNFTYNT